MKGIFHFYKLAFVNQPLLSLGNQPFFFICIHLAGHWQRRFLHQARNVFLTSILSMRIKESIGCLPIKPIDWTDTFFPLYFALFWHEIGIKWKLYIMQIKCAKIHRFKTNLKFYKNCNFKKFQNLLCSKMFNYRLDQICCHRETGSKVFRTTAQLLKCPLFWGPSLYELTSIENVCPLANPDLFQ